MRIGNGVVSEARQVLLKKLRDKGSSGASSYTSSSLTVELSSSTSRVVSSRMEKDYGKGKGKTNSSRRRNDGEGEFGESDGCIRSVE